MLGEVVARRGREPVLAIGDDRAEVAHDDRWVVGDPAAFSAQDELPVVLDLLKRLFRPTAAMRAMTEEARAAAS